MVRLLSSLAVSPGAPNCMIKGTMRAAGTILMAMLCLCATIGAEAAATPYTAPGQSAAAQPTQNSGSAQLLQLGPGDSVSVHVFGQSDMDGTVYISDDGTISVPLLGPVHVAGLTPVDASRRIEQALESHQLLVHPHVTLTVVSSQSQLVSILGEVHSPGRYPVTPGTTVTDLLAQAGGETDEGANFLYIMRPEPDGDVHRYRVDLHSIGDPTDTTAVERLRAGDSVFVPRAQVFYIYGEVNMPGMYRLEPGMTVIEAVARAGGINERGSRRRIEIQRRDKDGKIVTLHVHAQDPVQPDDNIRVQESLF